MKFNIVTIFPELINDFVNHGLLSKALDKSVLEVKTWNPRNHSDDKNGRIDDKPFGGGQGMLFKAEPIINTINEIKKTDKTHVIFVAPHGEIFDQKKAEDLKNKSNLTIICGRYEGMDHRIEQTSVDEVISIGDFIMNGGELPALVIMETLARLEKGFIGNENSLIDSFSDGLLEYPQYTRPEKSSYGNVPEVLLSGNHEKVRRWKLKESLRITLLKRPDLLQNRLLSKLEVELINEIKDE
jgi:tRNA (guanine37-N1)-methyltransferase|tara:strand:- start:550 stop:1272 length:723 start_codon:yes stop_codon:yes gene_type:complete